MSKIDVHHHFYPEVFAKALEKAGGDPSGWTIPEWTLEKDQQLAKELGIQTTILSVTAPGACIEKEPKASAALARATNEAAASIRNTHPSSYGFFASLPDLFDRELAMEEMAYALDTLHADGVILFSRYGNGNGYLGHDEFKPIWTELNRRKVVVFIHPTHAVDTNLINEHLPQPMFDYPQETGRTAIDMILGGVMPLVTDCKIILSHAGGTLPYLIDRVAGMIPYTPFSVGKTTGQLLEEAQQFYFDTALSSNPRVLDLLMSFAKPGHVLFGSDFPNAPIDGIRYFTKNLEDHIGAEGLGDIAYHNAIPLFPRLSK